MVVTWYDCVCRARGLRPAGSSWAAGCPGTRRPLPPAPPCSPPRPAARPASRTPAPPPPCSAPPRSARPPRGSSRWKVASSHRGNPAVHYSWNRTSGCWLYRLYRAVWAAGRPAPGLEPAPEEAGRVAVGGAGLVRGPALVSEGELAGQQLTGAGAGRLPGQTGVAGPASHWGAAQHILQTRGGATPLAINSCEGS